MATDYIKRIQSRLKSVNISLSRQDIIKEITDLGYSLDNLTETEIVNIIDVIKSGQSKLSTVENNSLSVPEQPKNTLSTQQRHTLTQIQAQQLGIELNQGEIIQISQMVADEVTDSIDYLTQVGELIKQFIARRNNQVSTLINEKISDIADIINTGNEQLGDIFNGANERLMGIVDECKQRKADYKSPYRDRLESIQEILQLPA